jgi:nitrogen fixation/metabolism regulation signal transduction histidine kinase
MAHEIKNPLTPIQLTVQQIKDAYHGDDENYKKILKECSGIIEEEIQSLKNLTKEFSDFARMPSLSPKPTSLNQLVKDVTAIYASTPFRILLEDGTAMVEIDAEAIKRVLINLIDNGLAALANKANGLITLTTQDRNEHIRLMISDNGHGIPKEHFHRIFEPHFSTKSTGMGLGLAIVKNILDEQKAEISVDSVENFGTTFTIDFKKKFSIFNEN